MMKRSASSDAPVAKRVTRSSSQPDLAPWQSAVTKILDRYAHLGVCASGRRLPVEVTPWLLLSDAASARDASTLKISGVTHVLNMAGGEVDTTRTVIPRAEGPRSLAPTARDFQKGEPPTPVEMPPIASEDLTDEEVDQLTDFVAYRLSIGQDGNEVAAEIASATPLSESGAAGVVSAVEFDLEHEKGGEDEQSDDGEIGCLGWLGILWVCGMIFSGCMRLCSG